MLLVKVEGLMALEPENVIIRNANFFEKAIHSTQINKI